MTHQDTYNELVQRLQRLQRQERRLQALAAMGVLAVGLAILALVLPVLGHWGAHSGLWRWSLAGVGMLVAGTLLWLFFLRPWSRWLRRTSGGFPLELALRVGDLKPEVRDRFADALQVYSEAKSEETSTARRALAAEALRQAFQEVHLLDFSTVLDRQTPRRRLYAGSLAALAAVAVWALAPGYLAEGAGYVLAPQRAPGTVSAAVQITPGDVDLIRGQDLRITATRSPLGAESATLEWRFAGNNTLHRTAMQRTGAAFSSPYVHLLERVRESLKYRVLMAGESSLWYTVTVVEPPVLQSLQLTIVSPAYTGRSPLVLEENLGDVQALPGALVQLRLRANKKLAMGELRFDSGSAVPLALDENVATCEFPVRRQDGYVIQLADTRGLRNPDPIHYRIELETDAAPAVRVVFPGQDVDLDESMTLPLIVEAEDDFGFSGLAIVYELIPALAGTAQPGRWQLPLPARRDNRIQVQALWDLNQLGMQPQDVVQYHAEVRDNDAILGPKVARSEVYRVRFPSIYEIYEEVASQHEETVQDLQSMREQAEKARQKIEEVLREIKREPNLNWEQRQKLSESAGATEKLRQDLQEVQQQLEEMVSSMERNDLLSVETLQKYMELQELLQKMDSPELEKALQELQKAMEKIDPRELEKAVQNLQLSQQELLQSLERTINLLKQLQADQRLEEAIKKTMDLQQRQEAVNEETAKQPAPEKREALAAEEVKMKEDARALERTLAELTQAMREMPNAPAEKIEAAAQMMQSDDLAGEMQQVAMNLQKGDMSRAQQSGQKAAQTLQNMSSALQGAQKEMRESHRRAVMQALQRTTADLLQLSQSQEQLAGESGGMNRNSSAFGQAADRQQELSAGLQRVADQLFELAQKSFAVTPEVARALGQAMNGMQAAMSNLEQRDGPGAAQAQAQAMGGLDRAVMELRQAMKQMGGAGGMAMGAEQFMQRLLGLSGQQQGINQESQQMGQQGLDAMQQQAALARLAAQQAAVQKSLAQLLQEFGNRSEILGRLDESVREMEDVVKDLQQQRLDRQTLERQQRILSRMLEAQRSMRERDYSEQRQAERAKAYRAPDPGQLPADLGERRSKLQEDLLRALREKYSRDYRDLIQRYFDNLAKQQQSLEATEQP